MEGLICKLCLLKVPFSGDCCGANKQENVRAARICDIAEEIFHGLVSLGPEDLICRCCEEKLRAFYDFFQLVVENQSKLQKLLQDCLACPKTLHFHSEFVEVKVKREMGETLEWLKEEVEPVNEEPEACQPVKKKTRLQISEERKRQMDDGAKIVPQMFQMTCDICPDHPPFSSYHNLIRHMSSVHKKPKVWVCCGIKLCRYKNLVSHANEHLNPLYCSFCGGTFYRRLTLRKHHKTCDKRPTQFFECAHCQKKYKLKNKVKEHLMKTHFQIRQKKAPSATSFVCEICAKSYAKIYTLEQHLKYDHFEAPPDVQCPVCGIMVRAKNYGLRSHIKQCHEEAGKTFVCTYCNRLFTKSRSLTKHITWAHTRGRTHICEYCKKGFYTPAHLKEHISVHTNIPNYFCFCGASFKSNGNYYAHKRRVHPNGK